MRRTQGDDVRGTFKGMSAIVGVAVNIMRDESFFKTVYIIVSLLCN